MSSTSWAADSATAATSATRVTRTVSSGTATDTHTGAPLRSSRARSGLTAMVRTSARNAGPMMPETVFSPARIRNAAATPTRRPSPGDRSSRCMITDITAAGGRETRGRDRLGRREKRKDRIVIKVGVLGAKGRMGAEVCRAVEGAADLELVATVDEGDALEALNAAEVAVDFTNPNVVMDNLRW